MYNMEHSQYIQRYSHYAVLAFLIVASFSFAAEADWPQYRSDASRSGYTSEKLPDDLALSWKYQARFAPAPAWVGRSTSDFSRMRFDYCYQPVIADGTIYFGSSVDCKVYALDAGTGHQRWSFFTEAPIRFAPVIYKNRLFVTSDDGNLYCLRTEDGKLLWKASGSGRQSRVIGNGRIISRWMARGGPVLRDGIIYFACGIWPTDGVYVQAVDPDTGKKIWTNDSTGALEMGQPHQICFARGGVAAQGYMAATNNALFVSTGRSVPACFDRDTGNFRYFHLQRFGSKGPKKLGDSGIVATDSVFFNTGYVFDTETGKGYSPVPPWKHWGKSDSDAPSSPAIRATVELFCVTPDSFLHTSRSILYSASLSWKIDKAKEFSMAELLKVPLLENDWQVDLESEIFSVIAADNKIAVGLSGKIAVLDASTRKTLQIFDVDAIPHGLAIAGGALFASTGTGAIYCFSNSIGPTQVLTSNENLSPYGADNEYAAIAHGILRAAGITEGWCLDLGCGDGELSLELAKISDLRILAVESDPKLVELAREKLDAAGLYGSRVTVIQAEIDNTFLPEYFANLIISARSINKDLSPSVLAEAKRLQRPYGGTICFGAPGKIRKIVRKPLDGAGQWTYAFASGTNSLNSGDRIAKGPLGILWFKDQTLSVPQRHGKGPGPLFADGILVEAGIDQVRATDAYNARTIWEFKLKGLTRYYNHNTSTGSAITGGIYCIDENIVYVRHTNICYMIDLFTGKELGRITAPLLPDGHLRYWTYIACDNGTLFGGVANDKHVITSNHGGGDTGYTVPTDELFSESLMLFAIDPKTSRLKWTYTPKHSIRNNAIALGDGTVYFIDRLPAEIDKLRRSKVRTLQRRGQTAGLPTHPAGDLVALDAATGRVKWQESGDMFGTFLSLSTDHGILLMSYLEHAWKTNSEEGGRIAAFYASTGKLLWDESIEYYNPPIIVGAEIYAYPCKYDLFTGKKEAIVNPITSEQEDWYIKGKTFGCGPMTGSEILLLNRSGTLTYADLTNYQGKLESFGGLRPSCWIAALPVGGIVLMPDNTSGCNCSYQNQASIALRQFGVRPPAIHPDGAIFEDSVRVTITSFDAGYQVRYTTDGSLLTTGSTLYEKPFVLDQTATIEAAVFDSDTKLTFLDAREFVKNAKVPPLPNIHLSDIKAISIVGGKSEKGNKPVAENPVGFDESFDRKALTLGGGKFKKGLSALTHSEFIYEIKPQYKRFVARVGMGIPGGKMIGGQDTYITEVLPGSAFARILLDGKEVHLSPRLRENEPAWNIDIPIPAGARTISLYAHFDESDGKEHWQRPAVVVNWVNGGFVTASK